MLIYRLFVLINFINFVIPTSLENKVKLVIKHYERNVLECKCYPGLA